MVESSEINDFFERVLFRSFGKNIKIKRFGTLGGGCINNAAVIFTTDEKYFLKWNESKPIHFFEVEAKGLELLKDIGGIRTPSIISYGELDEKIYLLMSYEINIKRTPDFFEILGQDIAHLHGHSNAFFGLEFDNYIGSLEQQNTPFENGIDFFVEKRLRPQAELSYYNKLVPSTFLRRFEKFYERLPDLLPNEKPALLHGDFWSGNFISNQKGLPVLIDPAVHYGNRESEIAFTHLFGGFSPDFYHSYQHHFPLLDGFQERIPIYQLYPLLVHLNIFGKSYLGGIERILSKFD